MGSKHVHVDDIVKN